MEMGHGNELVIGDGNFPSAAWSKKLVRLDGHGIPEILDALLKFFPLDTFVAHPAVLMDAAGTTPPVWEAYRKVIERHEAEAFAKGFETMERFSFYDRAKEAYAHVATGERALYANIILKKGVVVETD
jgi:L-fucose mutarotase